MQGLIGPSLTETPCRQASKTFFFRNLEILAITPLWRRHDEVTIRHAPLHGFFHPSRRQCGLCGATMTKFKSVKTLVTPPTLQHECPGALLHFPLVKDLKYTTSRPLLKAFLSVIRSYNVDHFNSLTACLKLESPRSELPSRVNLIACPHAKYSVILTLETRAFHHGLRE
jgi:hypothetical protein